MLSLLSNPERYDGMGVSVAGYFQPIGRQGGRLIFRMLDHDAYDAAESIIVRFACDCESDRCFEFSEVTYALAAGIFRYKARAPSLPEFELVDVWRLEPKFVESTKRLDADKGAIE